MLTDKHQSPNQEVAMPNYKMSIQIEMIPCDAVPTCKPVKQEDGSVCRILSETEAMNIDACEQALLQTTYPTLRDALATHLSELSKTHAREHQPDGTLVKNTWPYRVDGELGRFEFPTYRVCQDGIPLYDTARELFPPLGCWERYQTTGFKELAFVRGVTEQSYHKTTTLLNRIRHQEGATSTMTLRASVEREGNKILECLERTTTAILHREGFDGNGQPVTPSPLWAHEPVGISPQQVKETIDACALTETERAEVERNPVLYESPTETVNVSIDDVVVKQQKGHRIRADEAQATVEEEGESPGRKYVHNTVAHLQHQEQSYCITGQGVPGVLRIVLGYLLTHAWLGCRLQFFVDGQKTLQSAILRAFAWFNNLGMLLDWSHLNDKCARELSLAMKGTSLRNEALADLSPLLWYGRVESAKAFLQNLPKEHIKNPDAIQRLIGYFERNQPYIPCYEVRKRLGLRNSSNIGEKMNDLLVSNRQKHKGMSWSERGSGAIAALEALKRNHQYQHWFEYHDIEFKQAA